MNVSASDRRSLPLMQKGRHVRKRRLKGAIVVIAAIVAALLLALGGAAYGAYRYEQARADRILPGVTVVGVDVGGMTRPEAERAVKAAAAKTLRRQLTVSIGESHWIVTPAQLGRRADIDAAVTQALSLGASMGTFDRFWHRFRDQPVGADVELAYVTKGDAVTGLVDKISQRVYTGPQDASVGITDDANDVRFVYATQGAKLDRGAAAASIQAALDTGRATVRLSTRVIHPEVTADSLGRTIVVRVDQNKLYLYDGFDVIETFSVATAKPGYTTPTGVWNIYDKRENPTWYNPALDDWGAGLPAVIPGGPGNPMGTRAIYIDAPGLIRVHGTTDDSSIGRYASHGCIRMHNSEIEQLYPMIPVGAHVIVVGHRPVSAAYWSTPPASDI